MNPARTTWQKRRQNEKGNTLGISQKAEKRLKREIKTLKSSHNFEVNIY